MAVASCEGEGDAVVVCLPAWFPPCVPQNGTYVHAIVFLGGGKFGREGVLQCVLVMDVHVDVTARKDGVAQDATGCSVDHHTLEPFPVPPGILTKAGIFAHTSDPVGRISP